MTPRGLVVVMASRMSQSKAQVNRQSSLRPDDVGSGSRSRFRASFEYVGLLSILLIGLIGLIGSSRWDQESERQVHSEPGSYEFSFEGELSGHEIGTARFATDQKLDDQKVFVVQLFTPVLEGGVFLVFRGVERPRPGTYTAVRAETKGMGGYKKISVEAGEVAVLYYEMEREHMVLLGSTGTGGVDILESGDENVRGLLDIEVTGATGNPNAFLGVRPKRATMRGSFDATAGKIEFRKP